MLEILLQTALTSEMDLGDVGTVFPPCGERCTTSDSNGDLADELVSGRCSSFISESRLS